MIAPALPRRNALQHGAVEAAAKVRSLEIEVPLAEVYAGVTFPSQEEIDAAIAATAGSQRPRE